MRTILAVLLACSATLATSVADASARSNKPRLPAGVDPGGLSIAVLSAGIDYRRADVSSRLARDGEGELVARDLIDGDNRPYLDTTISTVAADASAIIAEVGAALPARFIPVRLDVARNGALREAMAFIMQTPAQIILFAMPHQPIILLMTKQSASPETDPASAMALQVQLDAPPAVRLGEILIAVRDCPMTTTTVAGPTDQNLKLLKILLNKDRTPFTKRSLPANCDNLLLLKTPIQ